MRSAVHQAIQRAHFAHGDFYDRHAGTMFRGMYRRVAQDTVAAAPASGIVLDAGCGSGRLARNPRLGPATQHGDVPGTAPGWSGFPVSRDSHPSPLLTQ